MDAEPQCAKDTLEDTVCVSYRVQRGQLLCSLGLPSRARVLYLTHEEGWDALHFAVKVNCKKGQTTAIKTRMPSIWDKR